jgi:PIN domain nuclease of toxin-antitoxin system
MLDTHALVWSLEGSPRLAKAARRAIEDGQNEVLVSAVCAVEIAIKKALGRLRAPDDLIEAIDAAGFVRRPLTFEAARELETLSPHHADPFDRLLIAHAISEKATIVTRDPDFASYPVQTLWDRESP